MKDNPNDGGGDTAPTPDTRSAAAALWDKMQAGDKSTETPPDKSTEKAPEKTPEKTPEAQKAPEIKLPKIVKTKEAEAPAEKAPEKTPEAPDFDKIVGPDEKSKHRPDWDKMKAAAAEHWKARTAAEQRLAQLEAELAKRPAAEADAATKARLAQLEAEVKDYSEKLKVFDVQAHPEFKAKYVQPVEEAKAQLAQLFQMEGVDDVDIAKLLSLDGKRFASAVSEALEQLTPFSKTAATDLFRRAKMTQEEAKVALTKVDELRQVYQSTSQARARAAFDEVGRAFDGTLATLEVPEGADEATKAGIESYNAALASVGTEAEKLAFSRTDEKSVATLAHKAARFDFMVNHALPQFEKLATVELTKALTQVAELKKELDAIKAVNPTYSGSGDRSLETGGGEEGPRPGETTSDFARRKARSSGLFKE